MTEPATSTAVASVRPRRRAGTSVIGILGEVLITAGVLVLLFLGWQLWLNDIIVGAEAHEQAVEQTKEWDRAAPPPTEETPTEPPVATAPGTNTTFGQILVPRFGGDFYRQIAEGTSTRNVLNKGLFGHYPSTQMPGAVGNFAIAAHRMAHGGGLSKINELRVGDHIFIETQDGWYQYEFRNLEYVLPTGIGVIDPVPQFTGVTPSDRLLTLTSCNPKFTTAERIIAYSVFDRFYPRDSTKPASGAPDEISATVAGGAS